MTKQEIHDKLDKAAKDLNKNKKKIGKLLLSLETDCEDGDIFMAMQYLNKKYGISISDMKVWVRIANDEIPEKLTKRIPSSKLVKMSSEVAKELSKGKHKIWSSENQQVMLKSILDFTKQDVIDNITSAGITPVGTKIRDITRVVNAKDFAVINNDVCVVAYNGNIKIHIALNEKIIEKIIDHFLEKEGLTEEENVV